MSTKIATTTTTKRKIKDRVEEAAPPPVLPGVHVQTLDFARFGLDILNHLCSRDESQEMLELYNTWKPILEEIVR